VKLAKTLPALCEGAFVERGDNLLAFGLPGRGKTHLVCAIGHELIQRGYRVLFTATYALVQRLLAAKCDLRLEQEPGVVGVEREVVGRAVVVGRGARVKL
jgi:DNA replication protein DnaC